MSTPILELNNSANWEQIYHQRHEGEYISSTQFRPLPEIKIPLLLEEHTIAVLVTSENAAKNWKFAGFLNQRIALGITVGGLPDADAIQPRKIWLNRITLIRFTRLASTYGISINIAKWLRDATITIWQYIGVEGDTTEELIQSVQEDLILIEAKVDALGSP